MNCTGSTYVGKLLVEFSLRRKMKEVVKCCGSDPALQALLHEVPPSSLVHYAIQKVIVEDFQISSFLLILKSLESLQVNGSTVLKESKILKLLIGLKVLIIFELVKTDPVQAAVMLQEYFPETGSAAHKSEHAYRDIGTKGDHFRKVVTALIEDKRKRRKYFELYYPVLYGEEYKKKMISIAELYLEGLDKTLPKTPLEQLAALPSLDLPDDLLSVSTPLRILQEVCSALKAGELTETQVISSLKQLEVQDSRNDSAEDTGDSSYSMLLRPSSSIEQVGGIPGLSHPRNTDENELMDLETQEFMCEGHQNQGQEGQGSRESRPEQEHHITSSSNSEETHTSTQNERAKPGESLVIITDSSGSEVEDGFFPDLSKYKQDTRIKPCVIALDRIRKP